MDAQFGKSIILLLFLTNYFLFYSSLIIIFHFQILFIYLTIAVYLISGSCNPEKNCRGVKVYVFKKLKINIK